MVGTTYLVVEEGAGSASVVVIVEIDPDVVAVVGDMVFDTAPVSVIDISGAEVVL
jgi:hypothetical protein